MRPRGTGCLYKQANSSFWWIRYYRGGKPFSESTKTSNRRRAEKMLAARLGQVNTGTFVGPKAERIRYEELAADLLNYYKANHRKSLVSTKDNGDYVPGEPALREFFAGYRAVDITTDRIWQFVRKRQEQGASNSTINRSLSALRLMFNLALKARKLREKPYIEMLPEKNVRKGFVEDSQYEALARACSGYLWLRAMLAVGYNFGWRSGELTSMRVRQANLLDRELSLYPGTTKNDEARRVKMTQEVFNLIRECVRGKKPDDYLFTRKNGERIRNFEKRWDRVCEQAGIPGLLFHDLRRSAVRNLERSGVPRSVAMKITGHKTEAIYRRYAIVSESDLAEASRKLEQRQNSYSLVIVEAEKEDSPVVHSV